MRNLFAQEGRGFPAFGGSQHVPRLSAVLDGLSRAIGYVGVSHSSLEFVRVHKRTLTHTNA